MVKKFKFEYFFDKLDKTYCPGETIHCTTNATVYENLNVRSLQLRFMGIVYVEFPVGEHKVWETKLYFTDYQTLFGMQGGSPLLVKPGDYVYEGFFQLPLNLPSSFKHEHGYIDYTVKAEYEWVSSEKSDKRSFYIDNFFLKSFIDLDSIPYPFKPVDRSIQKTFGYGFGSLVFYKSEPLCIITRLPKLVWQPGETIPITIEVANKSDVAIKFIRLQIIQKFTFLVVRVIKKKRIHTNIIYKEIFGTQSDNPVVEPSQNKFFETSYYIDEGKDFPVFNACSQIRSEYFIKTVAVTQGLHFNAENKTKIYIGNYRQDHISNESDSTTTKVQLLDRTQSTKSIYE